jgi:hypothetical protein
MTKLSSSMIKMHIIRRKMLTRVLTRRMDKKLPTLNRMVRNITMQTSNRLTRSQRRLTKSRRHSMVTMFKIISKQTLINSSTCSLKW